MGQIERVQTGIPVCGGIRMTYNFDPDQWYENEIEFLTKKYRSGAISEQMFDKRIAALDRRYDDMLKRLNGICQDFTYPPGIPLGEKTICQS